MKITLTNKKFIDQPVDCHVVFLEKDYGNTPLLQQIQEKCFPGLTDVLAQANFTGDLLADELFSIIRDNKANHVLFVGLGKKDEKAHIEIEHLRRAIGKAIRIAESKKWNSIAIALPPASLFDLSDEQLGQQMTVALQMAGYHFDKYFSDESRKIKDLAVVLVAHEQDMAALESGVKRGEIIADGVNIARHWIDLPPGNLTPPELAGKAEAISKKYGLKFTNFNEEQVNKMGLGGLAGVSAGSECDCHLLIMEYDCGKKDAPTLGFVGKGITFDSGGLSLKPPSYMETMKEDMSGAAAVIGAMKAIAQLKPDVNIVAITPLAENLPSGKATKPGDIITFYNGKTAEVKNTDAEGRLILADALSYAVKHYKLDALIDLATLTGACAYALGPFYTGMFSVHDDFAKKVAHAAEISGDRVWSLPLHDDYKVAIKSPVADISNIGSRRYMAGGTTAAHFLKNFVDDVPWVHLDIAGTAFNVPDISYYRPETATGAGVRLLVDLASHWNQ